MTRYKRTIPLLLVLGAVGYGAVAGPLKREAKTEEAEAAADTSEAVATVGDQTITRADLDERVRPMIAQLEQQRFEIEDAALAEMVAERLLEAEAARRGVPTEDLVRTEILEKAAKPTDAEVQAFYAENADRIGAPIEQAEPAVRAHLEQQAAFTRMEAYLAELKQSMPVEIRLDVPRQEVSTAGQPRLGPESAPVTIVEFSDFECPYCQQAVSTIDQVKEKYGDQVSVVFRNYPLPMHANAQKAAEASECAQDQGKFWEYHDTLFSNTSALDPESLVKYAGEVGLDTDRFSQCLTSGEKAEEVRADLQAGEKAGISGTPAFIVNGRAIAGAPTVEALSTAIEHELARRPNG